MDKALFIVDVQNDFVDGALGSEMAQSVLPRIVRKITEFNGEYIFYTLDTHDDELYFSTREGQKLPVKHCIKGTYGWSVPKAVEDAMSGKCRIPFEKHQFSVDPRSLVHLKFLSQIMLDVVGFATDICVISNVLMLRTIFPNSNIMVDSSCCAGTSVEAHEAALTVMRSCQIEVY